MEVPGSLPAETAHYVTRGRRPAAAGSPSVTMFMKRLCPTPRSPASP